MAIRFAVCALTLAALLWGCATPRVPWYVCRSVMEGAALLCQPGYPSESASHDAPEPAPQPAPPAKKLEL